MSGEADPLTRGITISFAVKDTWEVRLDLISRLTLESVDEQFIAHVVAIAMGSALEVLQSGRTEPLNTLPPTGDRLPSI